jgi:hypothetical protein
MSEFDFAWDFLKVVPLFSARDAEFVALPLTLPSPRRRGEGGASGGRPGLLPARGEKVPEGRMRGNGVLRGAYLPPCGGDFGAVAEGQKSIQ